jgi:antitoxin component of RelBE/YafQ-DinJ toxin-antitoxin module
VPKYPNETPIRCFRIPDATYRQAQAKAEQVGVNVTDVVRVALERFARTGKVPRR